MPTVRETDPDLMDKVETLSREHGVNLHTIVQGRTLLGVEGNLLDQIAPPVEWEFTPSE